MLTVKQIRKACSTLLLLLLTFSPLVAMAQTAGIGATSYTPPDASKSFSCSWATATEIDCGGTKYISNSAARVKNLKQGFATAGSNLFINENLITVWETGQTPPWSSTLSYSVSNPLTGVYQVSGLAGSVGGNVPITITDPKNVAPNPEKIITQGQLTGQLLADSSVLAENLPIIKKGTVILRSATDGVISSQNAISKVASVYDETNPAPIRYYMTSYNFAEMAKQGTVIHEGEYSLEYNHTENANCTNDIFEGGNPLAQIACVGHLSGSVKFSLTYITGGKAKVTILDSGSVQESSPIDGNTLPDTDDKYNGFRIPVSQTVDSPLDQAISNAVKLVAGGVNSSMRFVMTQIDNLLKGTQDFVLGKVGEQPALNAPWVIIKNLALSLLVMALIIIAFANVAQVDIEQYGLNRMIPKIIISIIMAMASWLIVTFFFDMSAAIQGQAEGLAKSIDIIAGLKSLQIVTPTNGAIMANIGVLIMIIVVLIGVLACGVVLMFLLLIRSIFLAFLLVVAPLAFIFNILPFTQGLTKQWWTEFFKWMFMGPIAMAIIAIGELIAASASGGAITSGSVSLSADVAARDSVLFGLVVFAAALYMAATLPLSWGNNVMKSWGGIGKNIWGKTGGKAIGAAGAVGGAIASPVTGAADIFKGRANDWFAKRKSMAANSLAYGLSGGRYGTSRDVMENKLLNAEITEAGEQAGVSTADKQRGHERYAELEAKGMGDSKEGRAWKRKMAGTNDLDMLYAGKGFIQNNNWATGEQLARSRGLEWSSLSQEKKVAISREIDQEKIDAVTRAGIALANDGGKDTVLRSMIESGQAEIAVAGRNYAQGTKVTVDNKEEALTEADMAKFGKINKDYANGNYTGAMATQFGKMVREKRGAVLKYILSNDLKDYANRENLADSVHGKVSSTDKVDKNYDNNHERLGLPNRRAQVHEDDGES